MLFFTAKLSYAAFWYVLYCTRLFYNATLKVAKQKKEYNRQLPFQTVLWKFLSSAGNVGFNLFKDVLQLARKMLLIAYVRNTTSVLEALADFLSRSRV